PPSRLWNLLNDSLNWQHNYNCVSCDELAGISRSTKTPEIDTLLKEHRCKHSFSDTSTTATTTTTLATNLATIANGVPVPLAVVAQPPVIPATDFVAAAVVPTRSTTLSSIATTKSNPPPATSSPTVHILPDVMEIDPPLRDEAPTAPSST